VDGPSTVLFFLVVAGVIAAVVFYLTRRSPKGDPQKPTPREDS
jgi:hypothetical protein